MQTEYSAYREWRYWFDHIILLVTPHDSEYIFLSNSDLVNLVETGRFLLRISCNVHQTLFR